MVESIIDGTGETTFHLRDLTIDSTNLGGAVLGSVDVIVDARNLTMLPAYDGDDFVITVEEDVILDALRHLWHVRTLLRVQLAIHRVSDPGDIPGKGGGTGGGQLGANGRAGLSAAHPAVGRAVGAQWDRDAGGHARGRHRRGGRTPGGRAPGGRKR